MRVVFVLLLLLFAVPVVRAEDGSGIQPLYVVDSSEFSATLPPDTQFLDDASSIEEFLTTLDGRPPVWPAIYGQGHHDPGHDDRLFALNRERDAHRVGHPALARRIAFRWSGELSRFDSEVQGFSVALGPVFTATSWGQVRFKPDDLPGELKAIPSAGTLVRLQRDLADGKTVEFIVVIIGRLIPEESIVYDFSHDQDGLGLIMPFVRVEELRYVLLP